jgi:uncharacterized protein YacL
MLKNLLIAIIGTVIGCALSTLILFLCGVPISFVAMIVAIVVSIIICFFVNTRVSKKRRIHDSWMVNENEKETTTKR